MLLGRAAPPPPSSAAGAGARHPPVRTLARPIIWSSTALAPSLPARRRRLQGIVGGNGTAAAAAAAAGSARQWRAQQQQQQQQQQQRQQQQQLDRRRSPCVAAAAAASRRYQGGQDGQEGKAEEAAEEDEDLLAAFGSELPLPGSSSSSGGGNGAAAEAAPATSPAAPPQQDHLDDYYAAAAAAAALNPPPPPQPLPLRLLSLLLLPLRPALALVGAVSRRARAGASQRFARSTLGLYWPVIARVLLTAAMLAIIRAGHYVPLPGVDLAAAAQGNAAVGAAAAGGALAAGGEGERMLRALYGQAAELPASLFDLGIGPHINASIVLMVVLLLPKELLPYAWAQRLRDARKEGKGGEALLNDRTNWLALGFAAYAAFARVRELAPYAVASSAVNTGLAAWNPWLAGVALVAGAQATHHCASAVTASGVGNGSTLVICAGIANEYASTLAQAAALLEAGAIPAARLGLVLLGYLSLALLAVLVASTELRLPVVQYASTPPPQLAGGGGGGLGGRAAMFAAARALLDRRAADSAAGGAAGKAGGGSGSASSSPSDPNHHNQPPPPPGTTASHFPILLNSSGVMPMIVASAAYYGLLPRALEFLGAFGAAGALAAFQATPCGLLVYGALVFAMEFLPFGAVNPAEVSEYFSTINVGIRGVAPGPPTVEHLKRKVRQCKLWGGLALALLAVSAHLFDAAVAAATGGTSLATTSLVIIVGAVLQTSRQVEALLDGPRLQQRLDAEREAIAGLASG